MLGDCRGRKDLNPNNRLPKLIGLVVVAAATAILGRKLKKWWQVAGVAVTSMFVTDFFVGMDIL